MGWIDGTTIKLCLMDILYAWDAQPSVPYTIEKTYVFLVGK